MESSDRNGQIEIKIRGTLRDKSGASPASPVAFTCIYRITEGAFTMTARAEADGVVLEVPLVSPAAETVRQLEAGSLEILKPEAVMLVTATGAMPTLGSTARVFNFVPGMEARPLRIALPKGQEVTLQLQLR